MQEKITSLTAEDEFLLTSCITVLQPFQEVTKEISRTSSSISEVIPTENTFKMMIKNSFIDESPVIKNFREKNNGRIIQKV